MRVIVARTAGFCKGVKDALEVTMEAIEKREDGERVCTYGPPIHNRQVLAMLEQKGIREENRIENCAGRKVVIRAHGIPPQERQHLHKVGATLLDATCRRVAKVQAAIKSHARRGYHTVIVGDEDHAEVIGLMGYTEGRGVVINRPAQVNDLPGDWQKVLLVAQTTQNEEIFRDIQEQFLKKYPNGKVRNTICDSTHQRQTEVREMCSQVDAMIIVGGSHSGNTMRLAEVARECAVPTYHVETEQDLNAQELARYSSVGVSAGASTPSWIIRNVVQFLESIRPERSGRTYTRKRILELLVYGNVYVALGAALLAVFVDALTDLSGAFGCSLMAAFYAFSMHSLNIYLDRNAIHLNDPPRAAFYKKWKPAFTAVSAVAVISALAIAAGSGLPTFLTLFLLVLLGIIYTVPLAIPRWCRRLSVYKLKDIPTSKTFFIPIAWASVTVLLPHLHEFGQFFGRLVYAFWVVFLLVLIRTSLLDLLAVQGDRLVGRETLVVLVGETRAARYTLGFFGLLVCSLLLGPIVGVAAYFAYLLLPFIVLYGWGLKRAFQTRLKEDPVLETRIEGIVMGAGGLALLWNLLNG